MIVVSKPLGGLFSVPDFGFSGVLSTKQFYNFSEIMWCISGTVRPFKLSKRLFLSSVGHPVIECLTWLLLLLLASAAIAEDYYFVLYNGHWFLSVKQNDRSCCFLIFTFSISQEVPLYTAALELPVFVCSWRALPSFLPFLLRKATQLTNTIKRPVRIWFLQTHAVCIVWLDDKLTKSQSSRHSETQNYIGILSDCN